MYQPLFGVETEYALCATDPLGVRLQQGEVLDRLMLRARRELPHLPDGARGMFLANGGRFYVDCGGHPEMTTPECGNPCDVVRYIRAGEAILLHLADREDGGRTGGRLAVFRCNVDYSGTSGAAAWGMHENYLHHLAPDALATQIIPHLASRLVYSGAGGFENTSAGIAFTLSPRSAHIVNDVSTDSTSNRAIVHDKREDLAGGGHRRLHLLCGESLCSDLATWLRTGTTGLVVALCEAGVRPGDAVALRDPVAAMRAFAGDPTCRATAERVDGRPLTAIGIQRHYLALAEAHAARRFMPPWAGEVCRSWRAILDRLERGWAAVATTLDWAIKLALYRDHARRRGLAWESLPDWTPAIARLGAALGRAGRLHESLTAATAIGSASPLAAALPRLRTSVERMGLDWSQLGRVLEVRQELFEIDTRFGQLGGHGLFSDLASAGVLDHRVEGSDGVTHAIDHPPDVPRARLRGALVRELAARSEHYRCDWQGVWNYQGESYVDLSDPFVVTPEWKQWRGPRSRTLRRGIMAFGEAPPARPQGEELSTDTDPIALNTASLALRQRDAFDEAERLLRRAIAIEDTRVAADSPKRAHRRNNLTLVLLRAGNLAEATALNVEAWRLKAGQHDLTSGRILVARIALRLLRGDREVGVHLGQLRTLLARDPLACLGDVSTTWEIPDVLTTLRARLPAADADLLAALVAVLNDRAQLPLLDAYERWTAAPPVPLEHPWPEG